MNYLYCGDNLGAVKEYNVNEIFKKDSGSTSSATEVSRCEAKVVTFISFGNNFESFKQGETEGLNQFDIYIGYSDGLVEIYDGPFVSNSRISKAKIKVSGEVVFIQDVSKNYINQVELGNKAVLIVTNLMRLYILRIPQLNFQSNMSSKTTINSLTSENDLEIGSKYIINSIELPGTNVSCVAYNNINNSIAYGGYESDVKLFSLKNNCIYWSCKNVHANMLRHRVPVDVTKIIFLSESAQVLLSGTGFGEIRIYSPNSQKRPLVNFDLWNDKLPVTSLVVIKNWDQYEYKSNINTYSCLLAVGNNKGSTLIVKIVYGKEKKIKTSTINERRKSALSSRKVVPFVEKSFNNDVIGLKKDSKFDFKESYKIELSVIGSFKGIIGGIRSMICFKAGVFENENANVVAISGPGRNIYLFDIKKRKLIKKIFTSQKISFMIVV
ncbi:hypothetical protein FG386_003203 [Cryptosporidium ryanae]|uniref:uncharacterized protein n=1 Tax=Cryptosporidium ryanae TaxID=515981 RepID=UPI00351AA0FE|nr:hypothetical protein FG386_003203 [Cryptosporidium ryanae]